MINFVVVDDNEKHRDNTEKLVVKYMMKNEKEFKVTKYETETKEFLKYIKNNDNNNIYILDFELPNTTAIDVARNIRTYDWKSPIIILTAHGGMAFESFKQRLQILDFISKQYKAEENLYESFDVCMKQINISKGLKFNSNGIDYNIPFDKILYIYRDTFERKIKINTESGEYTARLNMKDVIDMLPSEFKYSHKACIINTEKVLLYDWKKCEIEFINGIKINLLSRTHKKELI